MPDDVAPLAHEPDPAVGAWLGPRLGRFGATVTGLVTRGFAAYARVLHRLERLGPGDDEWYPARWADAAAVHGTVLHPRAQLWRVLRLGEPWSRQGDWSAPVGQLDHEQLPALLDVLSAHTTDGPGAEVVAALWEGFGWVDGRGVVTVTLSPDGVTRAPLEPAFAPPVLAAPRLVLPHRAYLLFRGPLGGVLPWCRTGEQGYWKQTPNLLWPTDRTWCVATEIDLDSTVVGGPRGLVDAICAHPDLEAFEVGEDDSFMVDGDVVDV